MVWGGQVWLTTAARDGKQLYAVCVDRDTGQVVHDVKVLDVAAPQKISKVNSYASPTPVVAEGRAYVHYGAHGTACVDTATGEVLWTRTDLTCDHHEGPGSSPILFGKRLIFHVDGCDVQYVAALDAATGKTAWKTDRSVDHGRAHRHCRKAFSTPTVIARGGRLQMVSPCARALIAYDPRNGEELWRLRHRGWSLTPRPVYGQDLVYFIMDFDNPELWAVRPDGAGDVTATHVAWRIPRGRGMPSTPTPLLVGDLLFAAADKGTVFCIEAKTGEIVWKERTAGPYFASPIHAAGRVYLFSDTGVCTVIEAGRAYRELAVNRLRGSLKATPAVSGKALYVRTEGFLYRIEE